MQYGLAGTAVFNDVTSGENNCAANAEVCCKEGFVATKGWDPLTGHGSLNFGELRNALLKN